MGYLGLRAKKEINQGSEMTEFCEVKNLEEVRQVVKLAQKIWHEHYIPIIGKDQVAYMLDKFQSEEAILTQMEEDRYIYHLLRKESEAIGYFSYQIRPDSLFLSKIYLLTEERGKGYSRKIVTFLEKIAKEGKIDRITLTVNRENSDTIAAYKKLGFHVTGTQIQDIGAGFAMDDYCMEKQ